MKRFMKLCFVELKLGFRSLDGLIFGVIMPVGILLLIAMIAGNQQAGNYQYTYLDSAFASLVAVGICASAFMGIPLTFADYREKKILRHFFVTPCHPIRIFGAIIVCNIVTSLLCALAVSFVAICFLGYHIQGNIYVFIGMWLLTLMTMYSIGLLLASLCRNVKMANAMTSLVYFPMLFLSGATIPFELFPEPLQKIAAFLPLSQGIQFMKSAVMGTAIPLQKIVLFFIIMIVCSMMAVKLLRWE